jgi:hypothetical protein
MSGGPDQAAGRGLASNSDACTGPGRCQVVAYRRRCQAAGTSDRLTVAPNPTHDGPSPPARPGCQGSWQLNRDRDSP